MRQRTRTVLGSLTAALMISLTPAVSMADTYWQCVPFARLLSGIQIFGDAHTWWGQATSRYQTGDSPQMGAVLCFRPTSRMRLGHVAVVSRVLTDRVIQITHANWSRIGGARGKVEKDVTVVDVSPTGDWTQVKVWYDPIRDLGSTVYPTHGFIYQDAQAKKMAQANGRFAVAQNTAQIVASSAAGGVVNAVQPGASPLQILNQAAETTDNIAVLIQQATSGGKKK
ncbi:MAG: CHAP domain-containing protein [Caulobacter sp.]|jgi:surface antigen